ncbi:hypothetical protein BDV19DRAFT_366766 [Aspergillus venezuelensis]
MRSSVWDTPIVVIGLIGAFTIHCFLQHVISSKQPKVPGFEHTGIVTPTILNVDRCVELHNAIINESASAPGHEPLLVVEAIDFWESQSKGSTKLVRKKLSTSLFEFVSRVKIIHPNSQSQHMLPFAADLNGPSSWLSLGEILFNGKYNRCVLLYIPSTFENDELGLVFDMETNKATWVDWIFNTPPNYDEHIWLPLDEILEKWLAFIRRRCIPRPRDITIFSGRTEGWDMMYPPPQDLEEDLEMWSRYVALVESKFPEQKQQRASSTNLSAELELEFLGFPQHFFSRARRPSFKFVAPSLVFPAADQLKELAQRQRDQFALEEADIMTPYGVDPDPKDIVWGELPLHDESRKLIPTILFPMGDNIHAGLCSSQQAMWQDSVGLVLPSSRNYEKWVGPPSNRRFRPDSERIWQVRVKESPFWRVPDARLARVLEKWIRLVDDGTWKVGPDGIEGKLENFFESKGELTEWSGWVDGPSGMFLDGVDAS